MNPHLTNTEGTHEAEPISPISKRLQQEYKEVRGIEHGVQAHITFPHYKHRPGLGVKGGLNIEETKGTLTARMVGDAIEVTLRENVGRIGRPVTETTGFGRDNLLSADESKKNGGERAVTPSETDMYDSLVARMGSNEPGGATIFGQRGDELIPFDGLRPRQNFEGSHSDAELFMDICYVALRFSNLEPMPIPQAQPVGSVALSSV